MRSSVSVILSTPPPVTTMSYPDYTTSPHHHQTLLVLVRQVGESPLLTHVFCQSQERIKYGLTFSVNCRKGLNMDTCFLSVVGKD